MGVIVQLMGAIAVAAVAVVIVQELSVIVQEAPSRASGGQPGGVWDGPPRDAPQPR